MFKNIFAERATLNEKAQEEIEEIARSMTPMRDKFGKSKAEKEKDAKEDKMDPVGQEDGDVDNDGDKDASDKYLLKRRKAIKKSMKKDDEPKKDGGDETAEMNPKKEAYDEPQGQAKRMMSPLQKIRMDKEKADRDKDGKLKKESTFRDKLLSIWEKADQTKGATKPDEGADANSGSAKKMKDGHGKPEINNDEEKSHSDASKAGRTGPTAKARSGGDQTRSGDQKVINKVKEAYASMYKEESND